MDEINALLKKLTVPLLIAVLAGFARFAFSDSRSVWSFFRGVIIAGFVGVMVSLGMQELGLSEGVKGMIIGVSSFCADEVAMFLLACIKEMQKDPLKYLVAMIDIFRPSVKMREPENTDKK